ncbi:MAG TPA: hypothetical protein VK439_08135 [Rubrivivax sp.]|nr:hypothetical protein [Rubrivivax sp.]
MRLIPLMMTVGAGVLTWRYMQRLSANNSQSSSGSSSGSGELQAALSGPATSGTDNATRAVQEGVATSPNTAEQLQADNDFGAFAGGASLPDSGRDVELQTGSGESGGDDPQAPGLRDMYRGA